MGNQQFYASGRTFRKEGERCDPQVRSQVLFSDDSALLSRIWDHVKESVNIDSLSNEDTAMPTNVQRNDEDGNELHMFNAERSLDQINARFMCGFKTPESHIQDLLEPAHAKYFTVLKDQENQKKMKEMQMRKTKILYGLFLMKKKSGQIKTKTFQEFVTEFLEADLLDRGSRAGIQGGFGFVMTVLQQMRGMGDLLDKSLENVIESLKQCEPKDLYENDRLSFSLDASINNARTFLVELIKSGTPRQACLSYKILLLLGLARACVEDFLLVSTFLAKEKRAEIDLRDELEILKKSYDKETKAAKVEEEFDPGEIIYIMEDEVEMRVCSYGSNEINCNIDQDTWIVDGDHIYLLNEDKGLFKLSVGTQGKMAGKIEAFNADFAKSDASMMLFNDQLYIRHKDLAPAPFVIVDKNTLKEIKQEPELKFEPKEGDHHSIQWKEKDETTGRSLTYSPMICDGQYLYLISQQYLSKEQQEAEEDNDGPGFPDLVVEIYDCNKSFEFVRKVTLFKNKQLDKYRKSSNSISWLKSTTWATNGSQLILFTNGYKMKFFDLQTGIKTFKMNFDDDYSSFFYYNYQENYFYNIFRSSFMRFKCWKLENVKPKAITGKSELLLLNQKQDQLLSKEKLEFGNKGGRNITDLTVIDQLMQGITFSDISAELKSRKWPQELQPEEANRVTIAIILRFLALNYKDFATHIDTVKKQERLCGIVMETFRYPYVTYLTQTTFQSLSQLLEDQTEWTSEKRTPNEMDLEIFLSVMKILNANMQSLNYCSVNLSNLLTDDAQYGALMNHFTTGSIFKFSQGTEAYQSKSSEAEKELWAQITTLCKDVIAASVKVVHKGPQEILQNLETLLDKGQGDDCHSQIQYLCEMPQIRLLFGTDVSSKDSKLEQILQVFKKISLLESSLIQKRIKSYKVDEDCSKVKNDNLQPKLIAACDDFLIAISEEINSRYSAKCEEFTRRAKDKKKKAALKPDEEQVMLANAMSVISEVVLKELSSCYSNVVEELEESSKKKKEDSDWDGFEEKFKKYEEAICNILLQQQAFQQITSVFITSHGLFKNPDDAWTLKLFQGCEKLIQVLGRYYSLWKKYGEKFGIGSEIKDTNDTAVLDQTFGDQIGKLHQHVSWHIGMMAHKLIKKEPKEKPPPENEDDPDDVKKKRKVEKYREQLLQNISKSNLLSGGIEVKHLKNFSQQTQDELKAMATLMQDQEMLKNLNLDEQRKHDHKDCDDCDILEAIVQEGLSDDTEKLIKGLHNIQKTGLKSEQANYKADLGMAMAGQADGMKLTRAAFGIMIKFGDLSDDFQSMQDLVAMSDDPKEIKDTIAEAINAQEILNCWKSASNMRSWLQERKTQRSDKWTTRLIEKAKKKKKEDLEKGDNDAEKKEEDGDKKEEEAKKPEETQEKKEEPEDKQIDSSSKPADEKKEEDDKKEEEEDEDKKYMLTEEEKSKVNDEAYDKTMEDINSIVKKVIEKASFMIKLNIPQKFKKTDTTMQSKGLQIIRAPSQYKNAPPPKLDWENRLNQWKQMQTKEGAITSLSEQKKEIWGSGMTAVQALLQAPIEATKIQENVEQIYLNASRRCAGFKLICGMLSGEMPFNQLENLISWFASALRMNEKGLKLSHYLDDLTGQGIHLETLSGQFFFKIIKSLVDRLKACKDEKQIKVLLNALKWTYTARDHKELVQLGLFSTLHKGSNEKDNLLKKTWGRKLKVSSEYIDDQELNHDVIDTFEQLFLTVTGRVVQKDGEDKIVQRQGKSSMPQLQKARSLVDEDVSEVLLGQAFEIIFKEFERYISIMLGFDGIDWSTYVRKRNQDRYEHGDEISELKNEDNILLDEIEEDEDEEEPEEEKPEEKAEDEQKPAEEEKPSETAAAETAQIEEKPAEDATIDEEERKKKEEEAQKKKDEEEQKQREEVVEASKKREEQEFKKLTQLYSENFLFRLLKLVELFTSIAECSEKPLSMVQRVANPYHMSSLLNLFLLSSPQVKIVVLKIIQHIIAIKIPVEVFEEAVQLLTRDSNSLMSRILNKVQPKVKFEKSSFLRFLYNYLFTMRSKMWSTTDAESDGQYAVTLTASDLLRSMHAMEGSVWANQIKAEITSALLSVETFSVQETDVVMSLLPGGEYGGMTSGQPAITNSNETVTILGYSSSWKPGAELLKNSDDKGTYDKILKELKISPEFTDPKQKALTLFYDKDQKERQDMMFLNPSSLSPVSNLDHEKCKAQAKASPLMQPNVVKHLLEVLKSSDVENSTFATQAALQLRQSSILKVLSHQIEDLGEEYIQFLTKEGIFTDLVSYLFQEMENVEESKGKKHQVLPLKWLEAKIQRIRKVAIETSKSLSLQKDDVKAYLLDEKEILFKRTDSKTLNVIRTNAYLCAAFNIHKVSPDAVFQCAMANDLNVGGAGVMKNGLVCMSYEELSKLEARTLSIMNESEAILVDLPEDANIEELFKKIVDIYKEDAEKSKKKRKGYDNILETVVFFVEKEDYPDLNKKIDQISDDKNQIDSTEMATKGPLGKLLKDLKQWGGLDEDEAIYNINPANIGDLGEIMTQIQEGIIEKQRQDEKYKDALKSAKQSNNEDEIKRVESAEEARIKKRKEVIAEKKKAILEAQKSLEDHKSQVADSKITEVGVYDEYLNDGDWWKELEKIAKDKISVRPSYDARDGDEKRKKTDEQMTKILWQLMTTFDQNDLQTEHSNAIGHLLSIQRKSCLQDIINKGSIEAIMPILLSNEKGQKNFAKYMKVQFNSSVIQMLQIGQKVSYQELKKTLKNIFDYCDKHEQFKEYAAYFFVEEIVRSGLKSVKDFKETSAKNVIDYFSVEERAAVMLNPYLLRYFTKYLIKKDSNLFKQHKNSLTNLMNMHLLMVIQFQGNNEIVKKLLKSTLYLISFCRKHSEVLAKAGELTGVIQNKLLNLATKSVNYGQDSDRKFNEQQLYLLEIHLKVDDLWAHVHDAYGIAIGKILEDSQDISKLKQYKQILQQTDNFDLLLYLHHLKNCSQEQKDQLKVSVESNKPIFDAMTRCHLHIPEVQRMTIKIKDSTKLKPLCYFGLSSDPDQEVQLKVGKDREIEWPSGSVYFTYPLRRQSIVCFGINDSGQLGQCLDDDFNKPAISQLDDSVPKNFKPIKAWSSHCYSCVLNDKGQLVESGSLGSSACSNRQFKLITDLKGEVEQVTLSYHSIWVVLKDNTIWYKGSSSSYCMPEDQGKSSFTQLKIWPEKEQEEKIVDIAAGYMFTFFVTEKGKLYARGEDFLTTIKQASKDTTEVNLPRGMLARRVWCTKADYHRVVFVELEDPSTGKKAIHAAGNSEYGCLGLHEKDGQKIKESQTFEKLELDSQDTHFVELACYRNGILAIDERGKLWAWGKNENFQLGIPDNTHSEGIFKPTELGAINALGMKAKKIATCWNHSLVLFEDTNGKEVLYSLGVNNSKYLGVPEDQLGDSEQQKKKPFREVTTFSDTKVLAFSCSERASLVIIEGETGKPAELLYRHSLPNGAECQGLLHLYKKDGKWNYLPWSEYEAKKAELPDLCFAIKCPIQGLEEKEWPDLEALAADVLDGAAPALEHREKDSTTDAIIKGPLYHSKCQINHEEIEVNHNEQEVALDDKHSIHPLIFYRLAKPLKKDKELPAFDLSKFYKTDSSHQIDFELIPDLTLQKNSRLIKDTQEQWDEVVDNFKKFNADHKKELLEELDKQIKSKISSDEISRIDFDKSVKISEMEFKDNDLKKVPEKIKKQQACLYWQLNVISYNILPYRSSSLRNLENSYDSLISKNKASMLSCVKSKVIQREIERLPTGSQQCIRIKRNAASRFADTGKCDHNGEYTIFGQIFQLCKKKKDLLECFKMNSTDSQMWEVQFAGEGSQDVGGPFRETLTNIVCELESTTLPLLIKTVNNRMDHGFYREAWTLNPDANSPTHQELFKFMGRFLGFNLRTGSAMDWHFTPMFWKQLIGDPVSLKDFDGFDQYALTAFKDLEKLAQKYDSKPDKFNACVEDTFTTILSNQKTIELCPNGASKKVTHDNYKEFIELTAKARLSEAENQMKWLKEGIKEVIDINILTFLSWNEIEKRACGGEIDAGVLKSITEYRECSEDQNLIKWFWKMFEAFTQEERKAYLKFVWGRSKIPLDTSNLYYKHRITCYHDWPKNALPKAHTCFFMIDIPEYKEYDMMVSRIKYAIETCGEIDDDYSAESIRGEDEDGRGGYDSE